MRIRKKIGLYYNRFRYYDPSLGQYTQQDPIGLAGGNPTLYGYVFNTMCEYYGAAEPPVRCGESHLSGLTEPLRSL